MSCRLTWGWVLHIFPILGSKVVLQYPKTFRISSSSQIIFNPREVKSGFKGVRPVLAAGMATVSASMLKMRPYALHRRDHCVNWSLHAVVPRGFCKVAARQTFVLWSMSFERSIDWPKSTFTSWRTGTALSPPETRTWLPHPRIGQNAEDAVFRLGTPYSNPVNKLKKILGEPYSVDGWVKFSFFNFQTCSLFWCCVNYCMDYPFCDLGNRAYSQAKAILHSLLDQTPEDLRIVVRVFRQAESSHTQSHSVPFAWPWACGTSRCGQFVCKLLFDEGKSLTQLLAPLQLEHPVISTALSFIWWCTNTGTHVNQFISTCDNSIAIPRIFQSSKKLRMLLVFRPAIVTAIDVITNKVLASKTLKPLKQTSLLYLSRHTLSMKSRG